MRLIIAFFILLVSTTASAELKRITCEFLVNEHKSKKPGCELGELGSVWQFDVDTDDFKKENPEYELTVKYDCEGRDGLTGQRGFFDTRRMPFEVTASTLSFVYMDSSVGPFTHDVDRETLKIGEKTQCQISEIGRSNKI